MKWKHYPFLVIVAACSLSRCHHLLGQLIPVFFCKGGNKLSDSWSDNKNSRNIPHGPGWAWDPYFKQGVLWKCHPSELEQRLDMWYRVSP